MARRSLARVFAVALIALLSLLPAATAFAAAPTQDPNPDMVGLWVSEESTKGETVSLSLFDDGTMQGQSEFTDGSDTNIYVGTWGDNGDDTVSVFIESVDGESIGADPFEVVFDVVSPTELNAADTTDFGDDGMTLTLEDSEPVAYADEAGAADTTAASSDVVTDTAGLTDTVELTDSAALTEVLVPGIYVTNELDADGVPVALFAHLNEDGTFQSVATLFDGATLPVTQLGTWEDNGDGTVTITAEQELSSTVDGPAAIDLPESTALDFTIRGDTLEGKDITLYSLGSAVEKLSGFAGAVEEDMAAETAADDTAAADAGQGAILYMSALSEIIDGYINVLVLAEDGTASFTFGPTADDQPTIQLGTWSADKDGLISVDLTQDDKGADLDAPATIVFEPDAKGNLDAIDFDSDIYGKVIKLELID